ncbi:hypothetical protein [Undibacterium sp. Ji49W]|uniref:hypothetical protein n=1 Tax=Undibacterium sp. Ji49W TaxID=3413040 RepID=UPI003BF3E7D2
MTKAESDTHLDSEQAVIKRRRHFLFGDENTQSGEPKNTWGLALSGGGIRSATFCLGVLQALALAKFEQSGDRSNNSQINKDNIPLLARFDYLSTVSGGGYIGAFFSSLFRPRKNPKADKTQYLDSPAESPDAIALHAYTVLKKDPPGRMGSAANEPVEEMSHLVPLRWLRDHGRYLSPNGAGDLMYDITIAIRNLCAVHYVFGISLLTLFLLAFTFRYLTRDLFSIEAFTAPDISYTANLLYIPVDLCGWGIDMLTVQGVSHIKTGIWWSPWFIFAIGWTAVCVLPLAVAYWYVVEVPPKRFYSLRNPWVPALLIATIVAFYLHGMNFHFNWPIKYPLQQGANLVLALFAVMILFSLVWFFCANCEVKFVHKKLRQKMTSWLSINFTTALFLLCLAVIETCGQSLYLWLRSSESITSVLASAAAVFGATITFVRSFSAGIAQPGKNSILNKIPLDVILGVLGVVLLLILLVAWYVLAAFLFLGDMSLHSVQTNLIGNASLPRLDFSWEFLLLFCYAATATAGYFLGFVNQSSLQSMYCARLTRAYLGASNQYRFEKDGSAKDEVTTPVVSDDFNHMEYYDGHNLGPAHLINVTINATTGKGDNLTLRDRHGLPLAITPDGVMVEGKKWEGDFAELSIGQWTGISGAAFSTGIGRGTSLGKALVFSLANVRLGWWWKSGQKDTKPVPPVLRNQAYLRREMQASFMGKEGSHWYLSDGGHFENTGVFELLRRRVAVVVCCDCGADPTYQFEDLANLIRLARIEFQAEFTLIQPDDAAIDLSHANELFANSPSDLAIEAGNGNQCALLYEVTYPASGQLPNKTTLIVIKPRLISDAPLDLVQYHSQHTDFPQESTVDQFFDDAQWESYRKLGVLIGGKLFPAG